MPPRVWGVAPPGVEGAVTEGQREAGPSHPTTAGPTAHFLAWADVSHRSSVGYCRWTALADAGPGD